MNSSAAKDTRLDPVGRVLLLGATGLALLGGLLLFGLALMTVISVAGRVLFSAPVPGDFELVEIGMAITVFAFLPYCQMTGGNVIVDVFTAKAGARTKSALDGIGSLTFAVVAAILTWRAYAGFADARQYGETSMLLRLPLWWGYAFAVPLLAFLTLVCAYTTWRDVRGYRGPHPGEAP